ncbi:MAG: CDP-alcohol phosphatidyltransferase family protein [Lentisphaeria bacterium]|nr:CDP-alcohol phosphatidyltransferase family protein [Lentisphaeria bacterium]
MLHTLILILVILAMLGLERLITTQALKVPSRREFIRKHFFLHPNGISLLRIPQGLISVYMIWNGYWLTAILWFSFWMITDLTDGTIARGCDLMTPAGAWLDPLADKCMSFPVIFFLALADQHTFAPRLSLTWAIAYCVIDTVGQCSRFFCEKKAANSFGKVKTALITVLIAILALQQFCMFRGLDMVPPLSQINQTVVDYMMIACTVLAFLSLYCKVIPSHLYANSLTMLNFLCGILATYIAWSHSTPRFFILAFVIIFLGQFFDLFDGKMARKFGSTPRGAMYDDIADGTNFGIACGSIVFRTLTCASMPMRWTFAAFTAIFYLICVIYRLLRFLKPTVKYPAGIFQGLPSPAGALMAGSAAMCAAQLNARVATYCCAAVCILSSLLMISNIPYRHFGRDLWPSLPKGLRIFILIIAILLTCFALVKRGWSQAFIILTVFLTIAYALIGLASKGYIEKLTKQQSESQQE